MSKFFPFRKPFFLFLAFFLLGCAVSFTAIAGDEDVRQETPKPAPTPEADLPQIEPEPEAPELTTGEDASPEFDENAELATPTKKKKWNPDENVDYSELIADAEPAIEGRGVLPPAPGFRGYRPNMIAIGYGDRVPGWGGMVEYNWNRVGAGVYYSYRRLPTVDGVAKYQNYGGLYLLYRWLPWAFSPYFSLGLEGATGTQDAFGGTAGIGIEAELYQGWTILVGYTYHSTSHRGFLGGGLGWSF